MKTFSAIIFFSLISLALLFSVLQDISLLFQTSVVAGIDGYYYVLQLETLQTQGRFYFSTNTPLILYFLAFLNFFTQDVVVAIKIGAIFLHTFLAMGIFALITSVTRNYWSGLFGLIITVFSGLHFYMVAEFLNNLGASVFLVWSAFGIIKSIQSKNYLWLVFSILFLICAGFCHRSTLGLIVLFCFTVVFALLLTKDRRILLGIVLAFSVILFFLTVFLAQQTIFVLPTYLEFELLKKPNLPFQQIGLAEKIMLAVILITTLLFSFQFGKSFQNRLAEIVLLSIVLWSFWLTLNPFLNHQASFYGIVGRLDGLAYLQAAITVPIIVSFLLQIFYKIGIAAILLFTILLVGSNFAPLPAGLKRDYLQTREKLLKELPAMRPQICEQPFIVAQHGEQFLVTTTLELPSQQTPPLENRFQCVFWLIHQPETNYQVFFDNSFASADGDFVMVEDSEIRRLLKTMQIDERRLLVSKNPHLSDLIR